MSNLRRAENAAERNGMVLTWPKIHSDGEGRTYADAVTLPRGDAEVWVRAYGSGSDDALKRLADWLERP